MPVISRRTFLTSALLTIPTVLAAEEILHGNFEAGPPALEVRQIALPRLPKVFEGFRIMFITDIHFGIWLPHEWVADMVRTALESKPDLIILGGDYVFIPEGSLWTELGPVRNKLFAETRRQELPHLVMSELMRLLKPLTESIQTLAVFGNHDHWVASGVVGPFLEEAGVEILNNTVTAVTRDSSRIWFTGTDDYLTGIPKLPALPEDANPRILITHNPDMASCAIRSNYSFDLALSGHTHGGQVTSAIFGPLVCNIEDERFISGLIKAENHWVYTSRGVGYVALPFRSNAGSEITLIELV